MTLLNITVAMPDTDNPLDLDPHDAAEYIIDVYNEERRANGYEQAKFVTAEWDS